MTPKRHNGRVAGRVLCELRRGAGTGGSIRNRRIMETVSENIEKRKRGRPGAISKEIEDIMSSLAGFDNKHSRRSRLNLYYTHIALDVLGHGEIPEFGWLANQEAMWRGEPKSWRPTILCEIGRCEDPETMKVVARRICELKPRTHDAVTMIRRWRLGKAQQGNVLQLTKEFADTMDSYRLRHPSTTWEQVRTALVNAMDVVDGLIEDGSKEEAA